MMGDFPAWFITVCCVPVFQQPVWTMMNQSFQSWHFILFIKTFSHLKEAAAVRLTTVGGDRPLKVEQVIGCKVRQKHIFVFYTIALQWVGSYFPLSGLWLSSVCLQLLLTARCIATWWHTPHPNLLTRLQACCCSPAASPSIAWTPALSLALWSGSWGSRSLTRTRNSRIWSRITSSPLSRQVRMLPPTEHVNLCSSSNTRIRRWQGRPPICPAGRMSSGWPDYPAATALLSDKLSVTQSYSAARCDLWRKNGLFDYAWINWHLSISTAAAAIFKSLNATPEVEHLIW